MPSPRRSFTRFWSPQWITDEATVMMILALIVGLGGGLGAVVFRWLIGTCQAFFFGPLRHGLAFMGENAVILIPALGALIFGPLIYFFAPEAKGHGVPEVMEAVALHGGRIRPVVVVIKALASSINIGSGGSVGREGPIVQIGAALGSTIGQWLHQSERRIRTLVACGAAAGIAATFNAPIAGVMFALEIILSEFGALQFATVVVASVASSVVGRMAFGDVPAFLIPPYAPVSPWELPLYLLLGVITGFVGVAFTRMLYWTEDIFDAWRIRPYLKPVAGGLLMGLLGREYPQLFGVGYEAIEDVLHGRLVIETVLALAALKIVATSLTIGSGGSGGVFAPSLFIGSMVGGLFGWAVHHLAPTLTSQPPAYALVGMSAVFAAAARAPITSMLILFEMTQDYRIILPLMLATVVSTVVAHYLLGETIYTLKLVRRGIRLSEGRDADVLAAVRVEEVMDTNPVTVSPDLPVHALAGLFIQTNCHGFPVVDEAGRLWGIVSLEDYRRAAGRDGTPPEDLRVRDIATRQVVVAYPDEPVRAVLQRMAPRDISRVPVVARDDPHRLVGVVKRNDIVHAYELGTVRRGLLVSRLPGSPPGTVELQCTVPPDAPIVGRRLAELDIPRDFLVIHIHRQGQSIVPHGDTRLQPGDVVTFLTPENDAEALRAYWRRLITPQAREPKIPPASQE